MGIGHTTREKLIEHIEFGADIMFDCAGKHFTILGWYEGGPNIAEQDTEANEQTFPTAEALIDGYMIDGKSLGERIDEVIITYAT